MNEEKMSHEEKVLLEIRKEAAPLWYEAGELQYSILAAKKRLQKLNLRLRKLNLKGDRLIESLNAKREAAAKAQNPEIEAPKPEVVQVEGC